MKNQILGKLLIVPLIVILSCTTLEQTSSEKKTNISFQIGSNKGGITENTDMKVVPGTKVPPDASADAFTGTTRFGFNAGVHISHRLKKNYVETGLDYMYNSQKFNYIDIGNNYTGIRELYVSQFMVPLTYNFDIPKAAFQIKIGVIGQLNLLSGKDMGILPEYSVNPFSAGVILGFSFMPFKLSNSDKFGMYCDLYRGSLIYKDFYNKPEYEMPGSSFIKFGLRYQFY
jgi:hypothetical protein